MTGVNGGSVLSRRKTVPLCTRCRHMCSPMRSRPHWCVQTTTTCSLVEFSLINGLVFVFLSHRVQSELCTSTRPQGRTSSASVKELWFTTWQRRTADGEFALLMSAHKHTQREMRHSVLLILPTTGGKATMVVSCSSSSPLTMWKNFPTAPNLRPKDRWRLDFIQV